MAKSSNYNGLNSVIIQALNNLQYSKVLAHYSYNCSHEDRKRIVNHLIDSAKVVQ
uniref:Uncharacterized protein n=1 Tax=Rhizophagus irregularis (strain DAOM 181602 / DAOM 197198 / MUCL 43194) TaxID=747089 RepID=U9UI78_RHIID